MAKRWSILIKHLICCLAIASQLCFPLQALAVSGDITGDSVNVRSGPGTDKPVVGSLNADATVSIVGQAYEWYQISYGSVSGWVFKDFCQVIPVSLSIIDTQVNVRKGPGTDYESYGQVAQGTVLTLLDVVGDWYKVQAQSGTIGYVRSDLVSESGSPVVNNPLPVVVDQPPADMISTIPVVPRVVLDGRQLSFGVDPLIEEGRLMVPLRAIFEAVGASVTWNQDSQTAGAVRNGVTVIMPLNSNTPSVNGQPWTLDVAPKVVGESVLAPVRFAAEAFGGKVIWDGVTYIAYLTSPDGSSTVTPPIDTTPPEDTTPPLDTTPQDSSVPDADKVTVTASSTENGVLIVLTASGYMKVVIKEDIGHLIYTIKNKQLASDVSISQALGNASITVTGSNTDSGARIDISYPSGKTYSLDTQVDGAVETVTFGG